MTCLHKPKYCIFTTYIYIYTHICIHYICYTSLYIQYTLYIYCKNIQYVQHIHAFIGKETCIHTRVHAQIRVCAYLYSSIKYLHAYVRTYVHTHTHTHTYTHTHTHIYIYIYTPTYVQSNYILSQICYISKHSFTIQFHTILVDCNHFVHDDSPEKNTYALLVSPTEFLQH